MTSIEFSVLTFCSFDYESSVMFTSPKMMTFRTFTCSSHFSLPAFRLQMELQKSDFFNCFNLELQMFLQSFDLNLHVQLCLGFDLNSYAQLFLCFDLNSHVQS